MATKRQENLPTLPLSPCMAEAGQDLASSHYQELHRLAVGKMDPRQAKVLEMHFFGGLTFEEIAIQLNLSARTVRRDWKVARAWLRQELLPS
jgi:RNA polymerase sigma factor (sigma-70 family)